MLSPPLPNPLVEVIWLLVLAGKDALCLVAPFWATAILPLLAG